MWFKNALLYRLAGTLPWSAPALAQQLAAHAFVPAGTHDAQSQGWVAPVAGGELVHAVAGQWLLALQTDSKLLPKAVIRAAAARRAAELAEQQGFMPGRRQMKEITEEVTDLLLPKAFTTTAVTRVWIDPAHGWLAVDATSPSRADDVFKLLLKSVDTLPFASLRCAQSAGSAMTHWLQTGDAPAGFTIDQDAELRAGGEGRATVRYVSHTLDADDVGRHIGAGKQCTRLALTWADRVSFVLTDTLALKRIAPLDVLKESAAGMPGSEQERHDSDFALMTGELDRLLADLVAALGGIDRG